MKKKWVFTLLTFVILVLLIIFLYTQQSKNMTGRITGKVISDDCLIAHYKFENNVQDSARGNNARNHGASFGKGKVGNALILDGIDDYVSVSGISTQMFNNTGDFTLSTWYMPTSDVFSKLDGEQVYFFGGTKSPYGLWFTKLEDRLKLGHIYWVRDSGLYLRIEDSKQIELNNWYHVASTYHYNTETSCLYINGELIKCRDLSAYGGIELVSRNSQFMIGGLSYGYTSPAKIDEAKIWDCALSAEQVIEEYESYGEKVEQAEEPDTQEQTETQEPETQQTASTEPAADEGEKVNIKLILGIILIVAGILWVIFKTNVRKFFFN